VVSTQSTTRYRGRFFFFFFFFKNVHTSSNESDKVRVLYRWRCDRACAQLHLHATHTPQPAQHDTRRYRERPDDGSHEAPHPAPRQRSRQTPGPRGLVSARGPEQTMAAPRRERSRPSPCGRGLPRAPPPSRHSGSGRDATRRPIYSSSSPELPLYLDMISFSTLGGTRS
jgi:hypothetical protein